MKEVETPNREFVIYKTLTRKSVSFLRRYYFKLPLSEILNYGHSKTWASLKNRLLLGDPYKF